MIFAYVAGPYSGETQEAVEQNVARAIDAGDRLEDAGIRAFIPHLSHYRHLRKPRHYEAWMEIDFDWLGRCDVLVRLPGKSSGADREVALARESGIPVFDSVEKLIAWAESPR